MITVERIKHSPTLTTAIALLAMLFGAGNFLFPIKAGIISGNQTLFGLAGFLLTAVGLPLLGLIGMILFDGNYEKFFYRLGIRTGAVIIFICMLIIGPVIGIPRVISLSHIVTAQFLPVTFLQSIMPASSFVFSLIFLSIIFVAARKENNILYLLGRFIGPINFIAISIIVTRALIYAEKPLMVTSKKINVFRENLILGYQTLDLLAVIFFCALIFSILKNILRQELAFNLRHLAITVLKAGAIGLLLLGLLYVGLIYLGAFYGQGLGAAGSLKLYKTLAYEVLDAYGIVIFSVNIVLACLSAAIGLSAVLGEYVQQTIFNNKLGFSASLFLSLVLCLPLATFGFDRVLQLTDGPLTYIGYPIIIAITCCNIAYKLIGFKPIRLPVILTCLVAIITYFA